MIGSTIRTIGDGLKSQSFALALSLVLLHGPKAHEIYINPDSVTTMRSAPGAHNEHFTDEARCMLNTSDGKFISVVETCEVVRGLFQQLKK
jgi:hypothetical protein